MRLLRYAIILGLLLSPTLSWAIVERLAPYGGPVPCGQFRAFLVEFLYEKYTGPQLIDGIAAIYAITWTANDLKDFQALGTLFGAINHLEDKMLVALRAEGLCNLAAHLVVIVDTPAKYRAELGIPEP